MLSDELNAKIRKLKKYYPEFGDVITQIEQDHSLFISNISHELRNVLTLMNSSLQFLETSHPELSTYKYWKETKDDCHYIQSLIHNLGDYNNCTRLNIQRVDIYKLLRNTYQACLPLTEHSDKTLTFRCQSDIPAIYADQTKLYEAFLNLIKNALEAIEEDGCVNVSLTTDSRTIRVSVEDNGGGIEPEKLITIFQPFVTYKSGGTGLGLSIVKRIIDSHDGHITVYSTLKQGTTITITLPKNGPARQSTAV